MVNKNEIIYSMRGTEYSSNYNYFLGDSGGPLMRQQLSGIGPYFFLAGIVSFGPSPCGLENWPGVYTRVDSYTDWILSHMRP